ncbi:MAG TPA: hypothetical protein VMZ49_10930, partial [Patescibacteria group bacterium]|nr:hypothetical protein [Patescibacteria group bacterium]
MKTTIDAHGLFIVILLSGSGDIIYFNTAKNQGKVLRVILPQLFAGNPRMPDPVINIAIDRIPEVQEYPHLVVHYKAAGANGLADAGE